MRVCGLMLGVFVNEKHSSKAAVQENAVWVANHCSPFDLIVLQVIAGKTRVITFPEEETTTAKSGLLKFQPGNFEQLKRNNPKVPVQPLSVKISRPFPPFAITVLDTQLLTDAFFLLFSPCTIFNIKYFQFSFFVHERRIMNRYVWFQISGTDSMSRRWRPRSLR